MTSFRNLVILGGILTLGVLIGSFFWILNEYTFERSLNTFLWSVVISLVFLIVVRVWDAWFHHKGDGNHE